MGKLIVRQYGEETEFDDFASAIKCLCACDEGAKLIDAVTGLDETREAAHRWGRSENWDLSAVPDAFRGELEDEIHAYENDEWTNPNREHSTYHRGIGL